MAEPQTSGVPDGWEVVAAPKVQEKPAPRPDEPSRTNPNIIAGAVGPKTREFLNTPLAHPTGVDSIDNLTSPSNLTTTAIMSMASAGAAASAAKTIASKAKAALAAIPVGLSAQVKYEAIKTALEFVGTPKIAAIPVAMVLSGYKKGAKATEPAAEAPTPIPDNVGRPKDWGTSLELTRAMKPTGDAAEAAKREMFAHLPPPAAKPAAVTPAAVTPAPAPVETPPAGSLPSPRTALAASRTAPPGLNDLLRGGMSPSEARKALTLLKQGVALPEVEAQILAGRPSAQSVAPAAGSTLPNQKALNELAIAARRAQVTLTEAEYQALVPLVEQGATAAEALKQLPALKLQQMPGVMTPEQVAAEIAARKGNRSPKRD